MITRILRSGLCAATALMPALARPVVAQSVSTDAKHAPPTLFTGADAALAAGFVGLTAVMFPVDRYVEHRIGDTPKTNRWVERGARSVEFITAPGSFYIGGSLYLAGRMSHQRQLADLGWHGTEAVLVGSAVTGTLKVLLGRARPYASADTNPRDFRLGSGLFKYDRQSFPSGHSTTAFAAAAAVTGEVHQMWPRYTWVAAPAMFGGATLVALSRILHHQHWASDVALGAAIGTFSGLKVVRYSHVHPNNRIDRALLGAKGAPNRRSPAFPIFSLVLPTPW